MTDKYADLDVDTLRMLLVRRDEQIIELKARVDHLEDVEAGLASSAYKGYDDD